MLTVLSSPIMMEVILPFVLVFTIIFAILQKSQILGKNRRQIDAIVALIFGLIFIAFGWAVGIILNLVPILSIALIVLLIFYIIYASAVPKEFDLPKPIKYTVGAVGALVVLIALFVLSGGWNYIVNTFWTPGEGSSLVTGIVIVILVLAAIGVVIGFGGGSGGKDKDKD